MTSLRPGTSACTSQPSPTRMLSCGSAPEHGLGQCESRRGSDLEILRAAGHQQRPVAQRLHGAGFVGHVASPALRQRLRNMPMRNICGVCASHLSAAVHRGLHAPAASLLSVSANRCASSPPTASCWQASIKALIWAGVTRQRAASCTSTQSWAAPPFQQRLQAVAHAGGPGGAATIRPLANGGSKGTRKSSPGATTTRQRECAARLQTQPGCASPSAARPRLVLLGNGHPCPRGCPNRRTGNQGKKTGVLGECGVGQSWA
jgi:hypothetical protein